MQYIINGRKVRIYPQLLEKIGMGREGSVYRYKGKVLKLHHKYPLIEVMKYETCEYLSNLNTERILLPKYSVCDKNNNMMGYIINNYIKETNDIYKMNGNKFLNERKKIQEELVYLGENYVSVFDFHMDNFKVSDKLYFIDPGRYVVHWNKMNDDNKRIIISNLDYFDAFLFRNIIQGYIIDFIDDELLINRINDSLVSDFSDDNNFSIMKGLEQHIYLNEPLEKSIKQLIKKYSN